MKKSLIYFLFTFCSFLYAANIKLNAIDDGKVFITDTSSSSTATYVTENHVHVSVMATDANNDLIRLGVQISNNGDENFYFNENSIMAYQGIYEADNWTGINYYPASKYYSSKEYEYGAAVTVAAIGCGVMLVDMMLANDCDNDSKPGREEPSNKRPSNPGKHSSPKRPGHHKYPAPRPGPSKHHNRTNIEITYDFSFLFSIAAEASIDLNYLSRNLLFSQVVKPGETVNGIIFINKNLGPDYKICFPVELDEIISFYFTRSDKQSILHPWKDDKESHSAITVTMGLPYPERFGFSYMYCGVPVGLYAGLNYQLSWINNESTGLFLGLDFKTAPHTWLMLGYECDFDYSKNYSDEVKIYSVPQVGLNFIFNVIDFGAMFSYKIGVGPKFDLMFGCAL